VIEARGGTRLSIPNPVEISKSFNLEMLENSDETVSPRDVKDRQHLFHKVSLDTTGQLDTPDPKPKSHRPSMIEKRPGGLIIRKSSTKNLTQLTTSPVKPMITLSKTPRGEISRPFFNQNRKE
jgi:hypothetical protein